MCQRASFSGDGNYIFCTFCVLYSVFQVFVHNMEWSNCTVLQLIEAYRERPVLWNSTDFYYKNRNRKEDAWKELAEIFGTDSSKINYYCHSCKFKSRRDMLVNIKRKKIFSGMIYKLNKVVNKLNTIGSLEPM